ncbi:hypothetical protein MJO29_012683 [Puccinia striiformis f. sp. tritici]|uniref:Uncharacterized protein n=2 Tax=Puccinia striiformis TaxID=27350 RepID=A0A0L0UUS5_9BASI|nr:hypothetical protein Pst134EB_024829 [Puccinia striiformis f. sp. tritici]KAI9606598.1 hypothetical protein H4Q26_006134 [Puccinia striiformis f. sp. tritici PST-130]KNE90797.1 hypothetical protein PSTG_15763 [Puccinia striiformis f. sp. tritici PST-78]POW01924.1 hypothetical protein PSHT_12319 [Puccinia striiformis]KAI7942839.1 hypothetical protein MJO29_012683 [Puccinia striiformis f. sp. tritici]
MSILAILLRYYPICPILFWIATVGLGTHLPGPVPDLVWEQGDVEDLWIRAFAANPAESISQTHPAQSSNSPHLPDFSWSEFPSSPILPFSPIPTAKVSQLASVGTQAGAIKRTLDKKSTSTRVLKRLKQGHLDPEVPFAVENIGTGQTIDIQDQARQLSKSEPKPGTYVVKRNKPNQPSSLYFSPRGLLLLAFLKETYDKFQLQLNLYDCDVTHLRRKNLCTWGWPIAVHESQKFPDKAIRVIRSSTGVAQSAKFWISLYKLLIGWMYELHQEILNQFDLPTYAHRLLQEKSFNWLEQQIFSPSTGLPVMGKIDIPGGFRWEDYGFGEIQIKLIKYFAQDDDKNLLVPTTASYLVIEFYNQHQEDYIVSNYHQESSARTSASLEFQMLRSFLSSSYEESLLARQISHVAKDQLILPYLDRFDKNSESVFISNKQLKSLHPKLPVAMYLSNEESNLPIFRILYRHKNLIVKHRELLFMFRRLVKTIDYFHLKILGIMKKNESDYHQMRKTHLIEWLLHSIIEPKDSLCVLGISKINKTLAPWEDITNGALNLFGQVQLELIDYFSEPLPNPKLPSSAIFILLLYYRDHHLDEFKYLSRLSSVHHQPVL